MLESRERREPSGNSKEESYESSGGSSEERSSIDIISGSERQSGSDFSSQRLATSICAISLEELSVLVDFGV